MTRAFARMRGVVEGEARGLGITVEGQGIDGTAPSTLNDSHERLKNEGKAGKLQGAVGGALRS